MQAMLEKYTNNVLDLLEKIIIVLHWMGICCDEKVIVHETHVIIIIIMANYYSWTLALVSI